MILMKGESVVCTRELKLKFKGGKKEEEMKLKSELSGDGYGD